MSEKDSASGTTAPKYVKCPTCGGPSLYAASNRFRPFCSERCKMIDLGAWGNEDFRMPAEAPPEDNLYGDPKLEP
ncbi:DNA gyrase inhibitor YacG [Diaphorobacter aerolatus]|uniref:DNA gyrase inhibitor YacG n=1 Tax=Diaphorobacter aerolatus TaxID=1288495 RepID=A0A7H0GN46_9BURK|nr:DNA gyrase inhibitor YacG [Diaphorobacter aerolatus]QNP49712.1 DNA gyrase inhibitor YacG [Diaphorobacter aerolatus]